MAAAITVLGWQLRSELSDPDAMRPTASDAAHAEQLALDDATAAAEMNSAIWPPGERGSLKAPAPNSPLASLRPPPRWSR